jgi:hypothetical protein
MAAGFHYGICGHQDQKIAAFGSSYADRVGVWIWGSPRFFHSTVFENVVCPGFSLSI